MIVSEIKTKLEEIGIDTGKVFYQTPKKVYARGGVNHVGMFSRELKQDFWFWDRFTDKLYCLKACWKNRKEYDTEVFKGNTKYQVPLIDFITYDLVKAQKEYTQKVEDGTLKTTARTNLRTPDKKTTTSRKKTVSLTKAYMTAGKPKILPTGAVVDVRIKYLPVSKMQAVLDIINS